MSANLKTQEVVDAIVARLAAASLSFAPKLIQDGALSYYVARPDLAADLPAILVEESDLALDVTGGSEQGLAVIGGQILEVAHVVRVVTLFAWTDTEHLPRLRRAIAQEIAEVFVGGAGYGYDLGGGVAGELHALPRAVEWSPQEAAQIPGQVSAVAVELLVRYRTVRS